MPELSGGRPSFRDWVDRQSQPGWPLMPLTHITKGLGAEDIIREGAVSPTPCSVFEQSLAYFFYGRPAYRIAGDGAIRVEAACPYCFIFKADLIREAEALFAFDTGAFSARMYKHILMDEMNVEDFSLEKDTSRPNRIVSSLFGSKNSYFDGDTTIIPGEDDIVDPWDFHARSYVHLLKSPGRNEPDDRLCSIEVIFNKKIALAGNVLAIVVPHTIWNSAKKAPWLEALAKSGAQIVTYLFVPGRHPEHYHAQLEISIRGMYSNWGVL